MEVFDKRLSESVIVDDSLAGIDLPVKNAEGIIQRLGLVIDYGSTTEDDIDLLAEDRVDEETGEALHARFKPGETIYSGKPLFLETKTGKSIAVGTVCVAAGLMIAAWRKLK